MENLLALHWLSSWLGPLSLEVATWFVPWPPSVLCPNVTSTEGLPLTPYLKSLPAWSQCSISLSSLTFLHKRLDKWISNKYIMHIRINKLIIVLIMILLLKIIYSINQHILGVITCRTQFPGPLCVLFNLILMTALWGRCCFCTHFPDEETGAQRGRVSS